MSTIPSISLIPSGYKANKVYSVLPTDGAADLTFARTSSANRVNSDNLIEEVATGVPRLDYTDGACPSLLLEPQSTNLVINSATGTIGSAPASSSNTTDPKGTNTAEIPVPSSSANRYEIVIAGGTYSTGQKLTYSWYRKRISTPTGIVIVGDLNINSLVNLTELEADNARQIESDINGFDRFEAVVQVVDGSIEFRIRAYFGDVVGVGNSSVAYWGHQFESLEYATSLITTTGTTQTRVAETASVTGLSSYINSVEGTLYLSSAALSNDITNRWFSVYENDSYSRNFIQIRYAAQTNLLQIVSTSNSSQDVTLQHTFTDITAFNKIAVRFKLNDWALAVNGVIVDTESSSTAFSNPLDSIEFGRGNGTNIFYSKTKDFRIYQTPLDNSELVTLTTI